MSRISVSLFSAALLSLTMACVNLPAFAGDMEDKIEAREKTMKAMGGGMKALSEYMKGEKDLGDVKKAATAIAGSASKSATEVFPVGTQKGVGESYAKPELWAEWAKAEETWKSLAPASAKLIVAAEAGDKAAIGAAMQALGGACKNCHEAYRIKKD
jgi:cytochrome c556